MWRSKKLIVAVVLATVLVVGSIGGIALAQENGDDNGPVALFGTLWDKVSTIYKDKTGDTLDQEALKEAFAEAQSELQFEAMQNRLQSMVEEEKITQEQADEYLKWWGAKPDVPAGFGLKGLGGFRGHGGFRGWCMPPAPVE